MPRDPKREQLPNNVLSIETRLLRGHPVRRLTLECERGDGSSGAADFIAAAFESAASELEVSRHPDLGAFVESVAGIVPDDSWFWQIETRATGKRLKPAKVGIDEIDLDDVAAIAFVATEIQDYRLGGDENSRN